MTNVIATWLYLIGNAERAKKLRARVDTLKSPPLDPSFGPEPRQCPTTVLFGAEWSRKLYLDDEIRPALDAWDSEYVTSDDIRRWCTYIEKGFYAGPSAPYAFSLSAVTKLDPSTQDQRQ